MCQKLWFKSPFGFYHQQHFTYLVNKIERGKYLCWCHTDGYLVSSLSDIFLDLKHLILETFLVVQVLTLCTSTAGGVGSILGHGTKILHKPCGMAKKKKTHHFEMVDFLYVHFQLSLFLLLSLMLIAHIWVTSPGIVQMYVTLILLEQQVCLLKFLLGMELIQSWKLLVVETVLIRE